MRGAGLIVALQGAAALVMAAVLVVRGSPEPTSAWSTAWAPRSGSSWSAAWCLPPDARCWLGKRWGRGLAVFTQLLLLPVAWYLAVGSHQPVFGIPVGIVALTVLVLLFSPAAVRWAGGGDQRGPASSANGGPDSR